MQEEGKGGGSERQSGGFKLGGGEGLRLAPVGDFSEGLRQFVEGLGGDGEILVEESAGEGEVGGVGGEVEGLEQVRDQVGGGGYVDGRRCPRGNR